MSTKMASIPAEMPGMLDFARAHARRVTPYSFTTHETFVLERFFSNTTRHTFLVANMPSNVLSALLAMYSRLKNERGLRGVFVDKLVPSFLVGMSGVEDPELWMRERNITNLAELLSSDGYMFDSLTAFATKACGDPDYVRQFASSERVRRFLSTWLDKYGHNSIARTGSVVVCCEEISMLAAKTLEHVRAGAGFIELSTRYVDMKRTGLYPFREEGSAGYGHVGDYASAVPDFLDGLSSVYLAQMGNGGSTGLYGQFLKELYPDAADGAIFGEVCDVMANVLPAAACTSVGCAVSGEALQSMVKCLLLEGLPETTALGELILGELAGTGLDQFARHVEPTEFERRNVRYLSTAPFRRGTLSAHGNFLSWTRQEVEHGVLEGLRSLEGFTPDPALGISAWAQGAGSRGSHDKLPAFFEEGMARFGYEVPFRTWRELSRHVLCSHARTLLTPDLGFFRHTKPISELLAQQLRGIEVTASSLYYGLRHDKGWHPLVLQYLLPMGFRVGATLSANLRQLEFVLWQRSGWNVNHECRQAVLGFDAELAAKLPWWKAVSRTDRTPAYRLAREAAGVPCELLAPQ